VEDYRVEMLRVPRYLDNQLTDFFYDIQVYFAICSKLSDGSKVVSPTHRQRSIAQKHNFSASGIHFC
jgi:hypothetical protein